MSRTTVPELSRVPTIKGRRAAWHWINNVLGVPVSMNFVDVNTNNKRIRRTVMAGAIYFSTQDLYDFVMSHVVEQNGQAS